MNYSLRRFVMLSFVLLGGILFAHAESRRDADAAVRDGLRWLAGQQINEGTELGSWTCGRPQYRAAVASLSGLAFLANGHLPGEGPYGHAVERAMAYVRETMSPDGYLGQGDRSGMYIHAICTLFGLSYLGTSPDPDQERELADWCRASLKVIVDAQAVRRSPVASGGWRYTPYTSESDVSVTCWQLLTLHAAQQCGYAVDPSVIYAGLSYVNRAFVDHEGEKDVSDSGFMYRPGVNRKPEMAVTGVALFIKSLLEREQDERTRKALAYLQTSSPSWGGTQYSGYFYFTLFYMTQGMFQVGGQAWADYSAGIQNVLIEHQTGDGHWPFPPDNTSQSLLTGHAYPTAMAVLILSMEKQYLPMYQRQKSLF